MLKREATEETVLHAGDGVVAVSRGSYLAKLLDLSGA